MNHSDARVGDGDQFPGILHIASTIKQHQVNNSPVVSLLIVWDFLLEKLFIYLALAKPALPGQFVLLVSSQSKENASKYFCLFRCAAQNKSNNF
jgi:hypothetical protein